MAWLTERLILGEPSYDHTPESVQALWEAPFPDLIFAAMQVHRRVFDPLKVQSAALLSVKTGGCPEDCKYCPQSARFETGADKTPLMDPEEVRLAARAAKAAGAERFCMGAAWRRLRDRDVPVVAEMIRLVKEEGMESCVTLGMAEEDQLRALKEAGLDYYNHNIDTSPEYYDKIITTRTFEDRLRTLEAVRAAGVRVCCGGIIGMGETPDDRLGFLRALANMSPHPESVPVNRLIPVPGTPLEGAEPPSEIDFVRVVAVARLLMPRSVIRLSAGRETMSDSLQTLCFLAGANSVFAGEKLLTAGNPGTQRDASLFAALGMRAGGGGAAERACN